MGALPSDLAFQRASAVKSSALMERPSKWLELAFDLQRAMAPLRSSREPSVFAAEHGFYIGPKGRPFCCSTRRKTVPVLKSPPQASGWPSICPPSSASSSQKGTQEELRRHRIDTLPSGVSSLDHFQDLRSFVSSPRRVPAEKQGCSRVSETARFCPRPPRAASLRPGRVFPEHAAACDAPSADRGV